MRIIFDTMDPSTATLCGHDGSVSYIQGGLEIHHDLYSGIGSEITIHASTGFVSLQGDNECRLAVEAMARALGFKLVKFGEA